MKEQLKRILEAMHKYNSSDMVSLVFNLSKDVNYDAIVIALLSLQVSLNWMKTIK